MKLYQYDDIKKLNQALNSFSKNRVVIEKVELQAVGDKIQYFVLVDPDKVIPVWDKVESKAEEVAKKTIKRAKKVVEVDAK